MKLPHKIKVILESDKDADLRDIIVQLKVRAGNKNPYYIYFPKTNRSGASTLTQEDFIGQFKDHWEKGLMDYNGDINSANPNLEVSIFDPTWLLKNRKLALAWPLLKYEEIKWRTRKEQYEYMIGCKNKDFKGTPIMINLEKESEFKMSIKVKSLENNK